MTKLILGLLASFAVLAIAALPAAAAPFTPELELAYAIANEYWGGPPSNCTSIDMEIVPHESLVNPNVGWDAGQATQPQTPMPCHLYVDEMVTPRLEFSYACEVVTHEDGHLHGLGHSSDPASIMNGSGNLPQIPACERAERLLFRAWNLEHEAKTIAVGYHRWERAIRQKVDALRVRAYTPLRG